MRGQPECKHSFSMGQIAKVHNALLYNAMRYTYTEFYVQVHIIYVCIRSTHIYIYIYDSLMMYCMHHVRIH